MSPYLRALPLVVFFLFVLMVALGVFSDGDRTTKSAMIGKRVHGFDMPVLIGDHVRLTPDAWRQKVVVVNVFATWCLPCVAEHPVLMRLAQTGRVDVYGVAWKDRREKVMNWLKARGNPYRVVGLDQTGKSTIVFGLMGVPETYVIDSSGIVRFVYRQPLTDAVVNETILPLVEQLRAQIPAP